MRLWGVVVSLWRGSKRLHTSPPTSSVFVCTLGWTITRSNILVVVIVAAAADDDDGVVGLRVWSLATGQADHRPRAIACLPEKET